MSVVHFDAPVIEDLGRLGDELTRAFLVLREAVDRGDSVVVTVADGDLRGARDPVGAALAHGLLGLVRALAVEGRKPGWRINMLAVADGVGTDERDAWVERLAEPAGASGTVVRLGGEHLGCIPV